MASTLLEAQVSGDEEFPFYHLVPKDTAGNVAWREMICRLAEDLPGIRQTILDMCSRDCLFWINSFVWTHAPQLQHAKMPFNTYCFQDDAMRILIQSMGRFDVVIHKSREMGASWICSAVLDWDCMFHADRANLILSRKEEYVDRKDDPKSLFTKIDFIHRHLPLWMLCKADYDRKKRHIYFKRTDSALDGDTTTAQATRGDRRGVIVFDEFASWGIQEGFRALAASQKATQSRWFNSTPQGPANAYAQIVQGGKMRTIRLHWTIHPTKRRGLYTSRDGELDIIDKSYHFPPEYEFRLDGKVRSPYYDREEDRAQAPWITAQEEDMDFGASGSPFFDSRVIERARTMTTAPYALGRLKVDAQTADFLEFEKTAGGNLLLWILPDGQGRIPQKDPFVVGCDVSKGTGYSESCASVVNANTGEKVAALIDSHISEYDFARQVVALCRWFAGRNDEGAYLIWEANGPGFSFGRYVQDFGYRNIYFRRTEERVGRPPTMKLGWWSAKELKKQLLLDYQVALDSLNFINRDDKALAQCLQYENQVGGKVEFVPSLLADNPAEQGDNHGDRVIADAVCVQALAEVCRREPASAIVPPNSFQARMNMAREQEEEQEMAIADW